MSVPTNNQAGGYIALITAILLSISLLVMVVAVSYEGFASRFTVLESELKEESVFLAEACVQTAIIKYAQDDTYNGNNDKIIVGSGECFIRGVDDSNVSAVEIRTSASSSEAYTNLLVEINASTLPNYTITDWEEVPEHP